MNTARRVIFVIGGTGLGKTKLGVRLAEAFSGEIINSDAMQLYKAIPIATAQPTEEEKHGIPHHLMGILDTSEAWTVRDYRNHALEIMQDIWDRGKTPIVVGGTLYYVQSLIWKSLSDDQHPVPKRVKSSEEESTTTTTSPPIIEEETAFQRLQRLDPARAQQLHPNDVRRVERSLQLVEETGGGPVPDTNKEDEIRLPNSRILWIHCEDREEHTRLLTRRVEEMTQLGLEDELKEFVTKCEAENLAHQKRGVFQAIGVKDVSQLVVHHRQYVTSQLQWIRKRIQPRSVPLHSLSFSHVREWESKVAEPALALVDRFLRGETEVGFPTCNVTLPVMDMSKRRRTHICEVCDGRILVGEEVWEKHVQGKSHKRMKRLKGVE